MAKDKSLRSGYCQLLLNLSCLLAGLQSILVMIQSRQAPGQLSERIGKIWIESCRLLCCQLSTEPNCLLDCLESIISVTQIR